MNINYCKLIKIKSKQTSAQLRVWPSTDRLNEDPSITSQLPIFLRIYDAQSHLLSTLHKNIMPSVMSFYFLSHYRRVGWTLLLKTILGSSYSLHHHLQAQLAHHSCDGIFSFQPLTVGQMNCTQFVLKLIKEYFARKYIQIKGFTRRLPKINKERWVVCIKEWLTSCCIPRMCDNQEMSRY